MSKLIEDMARAIVQASLKQFGQDPHDFKQEAQAALAVVIASLREPSEKMLIVGHAVTTLRPWAIDEILDAWQAMFRKWEEENVGQLMKEKEDATQLHSASNVDDTKSVQPIEDVRSGEHSVAGLVERLRAGLKPVASGTYTIQSGPSLFDEAADALERYLKRFPDADLDAAEDAVAAPDKPYTDVAALVERLRAVTCRAEYVCHEAADALEQMESENHFYKGDRDWQRQRAERAEATIDNLEGKIRVDARAMKETVERAERAETERDDALATITEQYKPKLEKAEAALEKERNFFLGGACHHKDDLAEIERLNGIIKRRVIDGADEIERLREALQTIIDGIPPVRAKPYRNDGLPSKCDKCPHDQYIYEGCEECVSDFARAALEKKP